MKAIMLSMQPQWVANILNGEKNIEIRKRFPPDYVGWVYVYCTKDNSKKNDCNVIGRCYPIETALKTIIGKGKVVARFWCDKITKIKYGRWVGQDTFNYYGYHNEWKNLVDKSMMTQMELYNYGSKLLAISITHLDIFDKPKELGEFHTAYKYATLEAIKDYERETGDTTSYRVAKSPQSWQWIEVEE
jgi:hypothetical protein